MDWLFTYNFSLQNGFDIVMIITLVTFLLVNKTRIEQLLFFVAYFLIMFMNPILFYTVTPSFLFLLILTDKNIKFTEPYLERGMLSLLIVAIMTLIYQWSFVFNFFMLKHTQSIIYLYIAIILCTKSHKNYTVAGIITSFNITWSSYAVLWSPLVKLALPLACLSLSLFLLHFVRTDFKGSIVHWIYCKVRHIEYSPYKTKFSSNFLMGFKESVY